MKSLTGRHQHFVVMRSIQNPAPPDLDFEYLTKTRTAFDQEAIGEYTWTPFIPVAFRFKTQGEAEDTAAQWGGEVFELGWTLKKPKPLPAEDFKPPPLSPDELAAYGIE